MKGCDWVFNLANTHTLWLPDKRAYHEINVEGTRCAGVCSEVVHFKVIHLSAYAIRAQCADVPFKEESQISLLHVSEYRRFKLVGDRIFRESEEKRGPTLVMIYPGNVPGQGDNKPTGQFMSDMINRRMPIAALTAEGSQTPDMVQ